MACIRMTVYRVQENLCSYLPGLLSKWALAFLWFETLLNPHNAKFQRSTSCVTIAIDFVLPESIRTCRAVASERRQYTSSHFPASSVRDMEHTVSDSISLDYLLPEACHYLQTKFGTPGDLGEQIASNPRIFQCKKCAKKPMRRSGVLKHMYVSWPTLVFLLCASNISLTLLTDLVHTKWCLQPQKRHRMRDIALQLRSRDGRQILFNTLSYFEYILQ